MEIIHSPNGSWGFRAVIGLDPATGKRKRVSRFGFSRRKDAEAALQTLKESIRKQEYVPGSSITFSDFADQWLSLYKFQVKESTVRIRKHHISWLNRFFSKIPLQEIGKRGYQLMLVKISTQLQPNTVCGIHATAKMIFKKAREYELIYKDPTEFASPPRPSRSIIDPENDVPKYLEKHDLQWFLQAAENDSLYPLFMLLAYTGVRIGEALALTWDEVNLAEAKLKILRTLYNPTNAYNKYVLLSPKTHMSARILSLPLQLVSCLKDYRLTQSSLRFTYGPMWHYPAGSHGGFVFTATMHPGYPLTQRVVQDHIDRIQKAMDPPLPVRVHPHLFRHTHASLLAEAGVSLQEIMARLGHADDDTTKRIYLHITKHMQRNAAEKFSEIMSNV